MLCYITMKSKQAHGASKYEFLIFQPGETAADSVLKVYHGNDPSSSDLRMMNQATTVKGSGKCPSLHKYTQKKTKKKKMLPMYPLIGWKLETSLLSPSSRRVAVVEKVHPNPSIATVPSPVCSPPWIITSSPPTPSSEGPPGPSVVWWCRFEVFLLPVLLSAAAYRHWLPHRCRVTHLASLWRPWWGIGVDGTKHFLMSVVTMREIVVSKELSLGNNVIW